jgi:hypothetical protein
MSEPFTCPAFRWAHQEFEEEHQALLEVCKIQKMHPTEKVREDIKLRDKLIAQYPPTWFVLGVLGLLENKK